MFVQNEICTRIAQSKFARYQILRLNLDVQSIKPGIILFKISVKAGILFISEFRLGMISVYFRFHYRQESCLVQKSD